MLTWLIAGLALATSAAGEVQGGASPAFGDVEVFTTVPAPGHPEGIVVDGQDVHVSTTSWLGGLVLGDDTPSHVFTFDLASGELTADVEVVGEDTGAFHGVGGIVLDGDGNRYAGASPFPHPTTGDTGAAVLRFSPTGEQQLYALLPDLPSCGPTVTGPCSPTVDDRGPLANDVVFDEAGNLYVSDSFQATVWRVPPGGGTAEIWLQDATLSGLPVGPNGTRITPDGTRFVLAVMAHDGIEGSLVSVPLVDAPDIADARVLHSWFGESPDGFTYGTSGLLWVVLAEGAVVAVDGEGTEVHRITSELFHGPASPAFDDATRSLLVTNHAVDTPDPQAQTVVRVTVDDTGVPLARPCFGDDGRRVPCPEECPAPPAANEHHPYVCEPEPRSGHGRR